jgi:hypothetical protein
LAIVKFADVGITPSKREAFGRVTFEYMFAGLPVVGANSGATPELIDDGKTGFIYSKDSASSLASKLLKYAKDKSLIEQHGTAAKQKTVAMMRGPHNADKLINYIERMAHDPSLQKQKQPLNFSYKWLQYPLVAQKYIDESKVISFKRLLAVKVREILKVYYLKATDILRRDRDIDEI